jgi:hypothetical protein
MLALSLLILLHLSQSHSSPRQHQLLLLLRQLLQARMLALTLLILLLICQSSPRQYPQLLLRVLSELLLLESEGV